MTDTLLAATALPEPPRRRRTGLHRTGWRVVAATVVGALVAVIGFAFQASGHESTVLGPGLVTIDVHIEHSHFDIGTLRVRPGTLVRFVVHNGDPIDHELVVGDAEVHRRHTLGTERRHPPVPGEVSVAPDTTALTFYEFNAPGTLVYACHLPGHLAYGMRGEIKVIPS